MTIHLDELGSDQLDADGTYVAFLEDKVVQSLEAPPPFVDPSWLAVPDIAWRWDSGETSARTPRRRRYEFTEEHKLPDLSAQTWLQATAKVKMRPERRAVVKAMSEYAEFGTGKYVGPSKSTIATLVGSTRENVNRHVKALVRDGWLAETGKAPKGVIVYALTMPTAKASHNP